jgi:hypothetical protein
MTWLTWRQQRAETLLTAALLAGLALVVVVTGLHMRDVFGQLGLSPCNTSSTNTFCGGAIDQFDRRFSSLGTLLGWLNFLPALIGVIFAVPLALELEHETYRLSWTQSVTRERWIAAKLAGAIVAVLAATVLVTLLITWWRGPWDHLEGRWGSNTAFNFEGMVPFAYALFALGLALALGTVTRRISVLVGGTLIGFLALRLPIQFWVRQRYLPPIHRILRPSEAAPSLTSNWVLDQTFGSVKTVSPALHARANACFAGPHSALLGCLRRIGFADTVTYQPASRFWIFQGIESAIFVVLAAALFLLTAWWIRRRVT